MKIIDGKKIANEILEDLEKKIKKKEIGLTVLLVGNNQASSIYVKMKERACQKVGIKSSIVNLDDDITENELLKTIYKLNADPDTHGILVQLPLPSHIDSKKIINAIDPKKDVDGFHPINIGKMLLGEDDCFMPCTPYGIKILLEKSNIDIEGKHVVIVGRSNIVGKPLASILVQNKPGCNASVTIVHSKSKNLKEITRSADILVAAVGKPLFIKKDYIKKGVVIVDVGISREKGSKKIYGDVDFDDVLEKTSKITPVPGGVGPMTIAMLLTNTYNSFQREKK